MVHVDIEAEEPVRAITFYSEVFDWEVEPWEWPMDYWTITTGPVGEPRIDVDDIDAAIDTVREDGGTVAGDVEPIPGVGRLAYGHDTEGSRFGVMEGTEDAA